MTVSGATQNRAGHRRNADREDMNERARNQAAAYEAFQARKNAKPHQTGHEQTVGEAGLAFMDSIKAKQGNLADPGQPSTRESRKPTVDAVKAEKVWEIETAELYESMCIRSGGMFGDEYHEPLVPAPLKATTNTAIKPRGKTMLATRALGNVPVFNISVATPAVLPQALQSASDAQPAKEIAASFKRGLAQAVAGQTHPIAELFDEPAKPKQPKPKTPMAERNYHKFFYPDEATLKTGKCWGL